MRSNLTRAVSPDMGESSNVRRGCRQGGSFAFLQCAAVVIKIRLIAGGDCRRPRWKKAGKGAGREVSRGSIQENISGVEGRFLP